MLGAVIMKYKGLVDPKEKPFSRSLPFEVQVKIMFWVKCFYTMDKRKKLLLEFKGLPKYYWKTSSHDRKEDTGL